jgi:hypothetical protein
VLCDWVCSEGAADNCGEALIVRLNTNVTAEKSNAYITDTNASSLRRNRTTKLHVPHACRSCRLHLRITLWRVWSGLLSLATQLTACLVSFQIHSSATDQKGCSSLLALRQTSELLVCVFLVCVFLVCVFLVDVLHITRPAMVAELNCGTCSREGLRSHGKDGVGENRNKRGGGSGNRSANRSSGRNAKKRKAEGERADGEKRQRSEQTRDTGLAPAVSSTPPPKPQLWRIKGMEKSKEVEARTWAEQLSPNSCSLTETGKGLLCATVTTNQKPELAETQWHLDNDFLGFIPLSTPENAKVDVNALTGLRVHALGSFWSGYGHFVWLEDALPKTIPEARIITYGYDAGLQGDQGKQFLGRLSSVFLDVLVTLRRDTGTQRRPLCFIGHSLGGVILKEALDISQRTDDVDAHSIVLSTYGLVLLGVPNLGLRHPQLMRMVYGQPNGYSSTI